MVDGKLGYMLKRALLLQETGSNHQLLPFQEKLF